jgi:large subunit ribosomal protein L21
MHAVIKTGGKQYTVNPGDVLDVEILAGEPGEDIEFNEVLMVANDSGEVKVGSPVVENAVVKATIVKEIIVFKFKRRKDYRNKNGHRQRYTTVKITDILN